LESHLKEDPSRDLKEHMQGGKSSCMCEPKTTKGKRDRHLLWMGWV